MLALAVGAYALDRLRGERASARSAPDIAFAAAAIVLGALLFAGSLAEGGREGWPGLLAGAACAALGAAAAILLLGRVRRRLDAGAQPFLGAYADAAALVLAALSILVPPVAFIALPAFAYLLVAGRRREGGKYEGLRILR